MRVKNKSHTNYQHSEWYEFFTRNYNIVDHCLKKNVRKKYFQHRILYPSKLRMKRVSRIEALEIQASIPSAKIWEKKKKL